jgi:hypothetical protein
MSASRLVALVALAACTQVDRYDGAFALPSGLAVTDDGREGPFSEPIAYVANTVGGEIRALATRQGRFLNELPTGSFLRGNPLPTGRERAIGALAPWDFGQDRVSVFAADQAFGHLVEVPHVLGRDGRDLALPSVSVTVHDPAGPIREVRATPGQTSTETWTVTWRGGQWWLAGDRSGRSPQPADPDEEYEDPAVGLRLTIAPGTNEGQVATFHTDSGVVEHDLGGTPVAVRAFPDDGLLAVAIADRAGVDRVLWFDPTTGTEVAEIALPTGARPVALERVGSELWIADAGLPSAWRVVAGATEPTAFTLPFPASDLAVGAEVGRLFVVPVGASEIWAFDLATGDPIDLNPWEPGPSGFPTYSPVRGIAALPAPSIYPYADNSGLRRRSELLAVSLAAGAISFLDQRTGCLVPDQLGPRTQAVRFGRFPDYSTDFGNVSGTPTLLPNPTNDRSVVVNTCAGLARAEAWRVVFRAAEQAWVVTGEVSGEQSRRAYEDQRYTTDRGQVSFVIRSGTTPSIDGWAITFAVSDGALRISSDQGTEIGPFDFIRRRLTEVRFALPGDPAPLALTGVGDEPGWQVGTPTAFALVPIEGANAVARILPDEAKADAFWR